MVLTQCCGLCLVVLFIILLSRNNKLNIYSESIFLWIVYFDLCVLASDILSCLCILNAEHLPSLLTNGVSKLYVLSLVTMSYLACCYTISWRPDFKHVVKKQWFNMVILVVALALIVILPIKYYTSGKLLYTYGGAINVTYATIAYFILYHIYLLVKFRHEMPKIRHSVMIYWLVIWVGAFIIQYLFPVVLIASFSSSIAVAILFFELENPSSRLDKRTGLFLFDTLFEYVSYKNNRGIPYVMVVVDIVDKKDGFLDSDVRRLSEVLVSYLCNTKKRFKVFKYIGNKYIIVVDKVEDFELIKLEIGTCCEQAYIHEKLRPSYIVVPRNEKVRDTNKMVELTLNYASKKLIGMTRDAVVYIDDAMYGHIIDVENTKNMIIQAINENRVEIFLQPIYSVKEDRFTCAEVLARIRDIDGSIIPPIKFIPVAEETGLILKIENIIFEQAVKFIKDGCLAELGVDYLEINLSVKRGESEDLYEQYHQVLRKYNVPASMINLEITETASIDSKNSLVSNMYKLIDSGVDFSLDDFGSGESNLNYIIEMPVSIVKFDKDMTQSYFVNDKANVVMSTVINMIHELGLKVVVEGVETQEQLDELKKLGVDYVQGYYFSKPLARDNFIDFVKNN